MARSDSEPEKAYRNLGIAWKVLLNEFISK